MLIKYVREGIPIPRTRRNYRFQPGSIQARFKLVVGQDGRQGAAVGTEQLHVELGHDARIGELAADIVDDRLWRRLQDLRELLSRWQSKCASVPAWLGILQHLHQEVQVSQDS